MEFTKSLIKGKLIKRYKRFFVDAKINKETVTAHCPNTGSMKGLLDEGNDVYLMKHDDPKRKLKFGLEIIKAQKNLVGVNTHMANKIVNHGLKNNLIEELKDSDTIKPEVFFNKLSVLIIVFSTSGITLTSCTLTPIEFNHVAIVEVLVS